MRNNAYMMTAQFFSALADETRLRLFRVLADSQLPLCVAELADILQRPQYATSRALVELRKAGLATENRRGKLVYYQLLRDVAISKLASWTRSYCSYSESQACSHDLDRLRWRLDLRSGGQQITYRSAELGGLEGGAAAGRPRQRRVLFVCVHNSARSQLAQAFLIMHGGEGWSAQSSGLEAGKLNPYVVDYLEQRGVDISKNKPRAVRDVYRSGATFDWVITVCDPKLEANCPSFPGPLDRQNWPFPDPQTFTGTRQQIAGAVAELAQAIEARVQAFLTEEQMRRVG